MTHKEITNDHLQGLRPIIQIYLEDVTNDGIFRCILMIR